MPKSVYLANHFFYAIQEEGRGVPAESEGVGRDNWGEGLTEAVPRQSEEAEAGGVHGRLPGNH